ncbi:hypothetical protein SAMN05216391_11964 [Lachnospiraceae bacterium KHCPX20]|nr:hypothetical protein SAMN05216391_11964 [Lachnospiraceae bacterium KHCPX20]
MASKRDLFQRANHLEQLKNQQEGTVVDDIMSNIASDSDSDIIKESSEEPQAMSSNAPSMKEDNPIDVDEVTLPFVPKRRVTKPVRKSFTLTEEAEAKLKALCKKYNVSENELINQLINNL